MVERDLELAEHVDLAQLHELADPPEPELGDELLDRSGHDHRGDLLADLVHAVHLARALVGELLDPALVAESQPEPPILLLQVQARMIEEHVALGAGADPASLLLELAPKVGDGEVGDAVLALALDHGSRLGPASALDNRSEWVRAIAYAAGAISSSDFPRVSSPSRPTAAAVSSNRPTKRPNTPG